MSKKKGRLKHWKDGFTDSQMTSHAWSLRALEREWRQCNRAVMTVPVSFTVREDGDEWFVILHGLHGFERMVMFFRCGNLLTLGATISQQMAQGKWLKDKYS